MHDFKPCPTEQILVQFSNFIFSLLIVAEITLFFETKDFKYSTAFTLTIMLVMYTMYQSIVETMTKTAHLKMLDYWLLFCLLVPFMTFMVEVYWFLRQSKDSATPQKNKWLKLDFIMNQKFIQIFLPTTTAIFVFLYFIAATIIITANT